MLEQLAKCEICPFRCKVNRLSGQVGRCGCGDKIRVAKYQLHYFEEPCISGKSGSGTVFFSNCNFKCIFCQNYKISQEGKGNEVTIEELANIFLRDLRGYVDVYLPDLKYYADELAIKYSKAPNYFKIATKAILEMINQVGLPEFDENGMIKKGVIIRHLVLPGHIQNSKHILKWLKENVEGNAYVSVMAQYFPTYKAKEDEYLNRKLTRKEYSEIEQYLYLLDIQNGYMQELGKHEEEYVPDF